MKQCTYKVVIINLTQYYKKKITANMHGENFLSDKQEIPPLAYHGN